MVWNSLLLIALALTLSGVCGAEQNRGNAVPRPAVGMPATDTAGLRGPVATRAWARDRSELGVGVGTAWLLVIDPHGNRSGVDTARVKELTEITGSGQWLSGIPQSHVYQDWTGDTTFSLSVEIERPAEGTYRLIVVAAGQKTSELAVHAFASDGSSQPGIRVPLDFEKTRSAEFRLEFRKMPGTTSRLERINPAGSP